MMSGRVSWSIDWSIDWDSSPQGTSLYPGRGGLHDGKTWVKYMPQKHAFLPHVVSSTHRSRERPPWTLHSQGIKPRPQACSIVPNWRRHCQCQWHFTVERERERESPESPGNPSPSRVHKRNRETETEKTRFSIVQERAHTHIYI